MIDLSNNGERVQIGITCAGEVGRHINRYFFALQHINKYETEIKNICDFGCGTGYGSAILASSGKKVAGIDVCQEVINYAKTQYKNVQFHTKDVTAKKLDLDFDCAIAFEIIEHVEDLKQLFENLYFAKIIIGSYPYLERLGNNPYHVRYRLTKRLAIDNLGSQYHINFWFQTADGAIVKETTNRVNTIFVAKKNE